MIAYLESNIPDLRVAYSSRLRFPAHLHRHVELVLLLESEATAYADTEQCRLRAGDAFIAFPNRVHRYDPPVPGERSIIIVVDPEMMPDICHIFFENLPESAHLEGFVCDEIVSICDRLIRILKTSLPLEIAERRALLTALFSRVLCACRLCPTGRREESDAMAAVATYCAQHYTEDLSLSVLERELHINRYYISHVFANKLKIGFNDYINSLRISHACRYLRREKRPITEISALVGFSNPRTFNRAFLKCMGTTPSEYRKQKE